jgi:hypothetical protein
MSKRSERAGTGGSRGSAPRAFLHLSEGNEIAAEQPSTARKAVVLLLASLFIAAVPMLWANSAQGDEQAVRPSAGGPVTEYGDDDDGDDSDDGNGGSTDSGPSGRSKGTGSRDSAKTKGTTRNTNDSTDDKGSARTAGTGSKDSARTAHTTNPSTGLKTDDSNSRKTRGTGSRDSNKTRGTTKGTRG